MTTHSLPKLSAILAFIILSTCAQISQAQQDARPRVLVLPFNAFYAPDQPQNYNWISKAVQDNTVVVLSQAGRFTPVAYSGELKTTVDAATAAKLAKTANLPYAIYGSATIVEKNVRLSAQLIDSSTGEIILTATSTGLTTNLLTLEDDLAQKLNTTAPQNNPPAAAAPNNQPPQNVQAPQQPEKSVAVQTLELEQLKRDMARLAQQQAAQQQNQQLAQQQQPYTYYPQPTYGTTGSLPPDLSLTAQTNYGNYYNPYYTPYYSPYLYSNIIYTGYYPPYNYYPVCNTGFYFNGSFYGNNWNSTIRIGNPYYCNTPRFGGGYPNYNNFNHYNNFNSYRGPRTSLISAPPPRPSQNSISPMTPGIVNFNATTITRTNTGRR